MTERKEKKSSLPWIITGAGALIVSKLKLVLSLLKFGKFGGMALSMVLSVGAYALAAPLPFAIGFVVLLLIHEMGHVFAARRKGLPVSAPVFIPFLGALITMKRNPRDAVTEAYIAFGGPILGTAGALLFLGAAVLLDNGLLASLASIGFFLNLINLLPIHPLDGGRISTAVTRWLWLVGLIGGLVIIIYLRSILFFIIWAMFAWELYSKYIGKKRGGKGKVRMAAITCELELAPLLEQGMPLPGERHTRDLPFQTYSGLDGTQTVEFFWDSLGLHGKIDMPAQSLIHRVRVAGTKRNDAAGKFLVLVQAECEPFENDNYYNVPLRTRWAYGSVYLALAVFLGGMIVVSRSLI